MKHVNVRALLVSKGVRNRLQYLIVYKSKRILVCVISVCSVYHVTTNIIATYQKASKHISSVLLFYGLR